MVEDSSQRDGSFYIPGFLEIQNKSFFQFLEMGIIKEFQRMGPILAGAGEIEIQFYPNRFILTPPDYTIREAILKGKTYESKLFVPARMVSKGGIGRKAEWVPVGNIPLMTRRGHFIINGSPRVIVNQMVRSPGIYVHRRFVGGRRRREVYYVDVIPLVGSWLRLQQKEGEPLYAHLKRTPKIPYQLLCTSMAAFEKDIFGEKETSSPLWRYRARLALHLLERFVNSTLFVGELKKARQDLAEFREAQLGRFVVDEGSLKGMAEQLLSHWEERIESEFPSPRREAGPSKGLTMMKMKEPVIPTPSLPSSSGKGRFDTRGGEKMESIVEEDFLLRACTASQGGGEDKEGWNWRGQPVDLGADLEVIKEELVMAERKKARGREMVLSEIASSLGLVGRRPVSWDGGKVGRLNQLMGRADLGEVSDLCTNKEARGDILTEIACHLFLRASPSGWQRGRVFLYNRFKNPATYTLGRLGRARIAKKLEDRTIGSLLPCPSTQLMARDLELAYAYLRRVRARNVLVDDIDHLKNRRVKTCGELLQNQFQVGLSRLKTLLRFKVTRGDESISLTKVIDVKVLDAAWREFFGSNPLSQYMDQTNPLAEITHKRRVSCLGPGGVSRETAGMAMRGIHPSHYGRICPIETPEGKNAGLVNSLGSYTRIGPAGVLETPYYLVKKGQVQRRAGFHFFSAQREEEEKACIAPADVTCAGRHLLPAASLPLRKGENLLDNFSQTSREGIQYVGISRIQMISIATSLIPFLEHNDANRALMGSNMQRQAVPLLTVEPPIVGTGLDGRIVAESGHTVEAQRGGRIAYVSGRKIIVQQRGGEFRRTGWAPQLSRSSVRPSLLAPSERTSSGQKGDEAKGQRVERLKDRRKERSSPSIVHFSYNRLDLFTLQRDGRKYSTLHPGPTSSSRRGKGWMSTEVSPLVEDSYPLQTFERSNQKTSLCQKPWVREGNWVQSGDLLADCATSRGGQLCLGRNVVIAYLPWDGYNFEDAVVVSDRLLSDDLYTSLHIEQCETHLEETEKEVVTITRWNSHLKPVERASLDKDGVVRIGSWVEPGDVLVSKVMLIEPIPLSGYERLAYEIIRKKPPTTRDISLRVDKWVEGRVIDVEKIWEKRRGQPDKLVGVELSLVERKKIQVGDKVAGRHGNKGIVSTILPRQDMPYLPDGTTVDMVLNPLGVPSRMNVGQVFESLLGLAGGFLRQRFKITPFDEIYGSEASRSLVYLKLYQARLRTGQDWLFCPEFPGKIKLFDGRSGESFQQPVTVGRGYMLKLIHLVDEKIHARSRGPYSLITQQPVRGRARGGGQRLGEMEVWAVEGYGAAYTLQEILTTKSDDMKSRRKAWQWIVENPRTSGRKELPLGRSDGFKLVLRELQSLCLDVGIFGWGWNHTPKIEMTHTNMIRQRSITRLSPPA